MTHGEADCLPFGVDRNLGTELVDQIVGNVSLAVNNGTLENGAQLPGIRRLAKELDVMRDISIRSFAGTRSSFENLSLLPKGQMLVHPLKEEDREDIFYQTQQILSGTFRDKIWEMIWKRWEHYEAVCNQGSGE